jgi:hypothetical protein
MRITPEILLKIANDTVSQRVRSNRDILAAYLQGSLLRDSPLLGGTTDLDLYFIYNEDLAEKREIERITDDIHLDIVHHPRSLYRQTREIRLHPWLGPGVYGCKILYDPQHFMDFTQASVRGQFYHPENVLVRARTQCDQARQIWLSFHLEPKEPNYDDIVQYLHAVGLVANAVASLNGPPLTERRFLLDFPERVDAVGRPGMFQGLLGLIGGSTIDADTLGVWLTVWREAYQALPADDAPPNLHPFRVNYYFRAYDAMLGSQEPVVSLWPILHTWTDAIGILPAESSYRGEWREVCTQLGLWGSVFTERVAGLDAFLDLVEETLEAWAHEHGA